jgi:precorrin-6Y C5,15-methyltransferase (decarboxylating)
MISNKLNANSICILMSGDTGFYSGTKKLLEKLEGWDVTVLPGVSSVQYFAARLCRAWENWKLRAHTERTSIPLRLCGSMRNLFSDRGCVTVTENCRQLPMRGLTA